MNLLKRIVFLLILFLSSCYGFSQEISIRGGFNLSHFRDDDGKVVSKENSSNPGFHFGPILEIPIIKRSTNMFSIETGILFSSKGNKWTYPGPFGGGITDYYKRENLFYLDLPVLLKMTTEVKKLKVFALAGPYMGEALYGKTKSSSIINDPPEKWEWKNSTRWGEQYSRFDYGIKLGLGLRYAKCQIGASYEFGLNDLQKVINEPASIRKNRVIELYVAYTLINFKSNKR